jgi:dATP pyrophosphohydrolase
VLEETGFDIEAAGGELRDWQLANVYEIYPHWRHRYAPGVTRNTEHVFGLQVPAPRCRLAPREHLPGSGCPGRRRPTAASRPPMPKPILQLPRFSPVPT